MRSCLFHQSSKSIPCAPVSFRILCKTVQRLTNQIILTFLGVERQSSSPLQAVAMFLHFRETKNRGLALPTASAGLGREQKMTQPLHAARGASGDGMWPGNGFGPGLVLLTGRWPSVLRFHKGATHGGPRAFCLPLFDFGTRPSQLMC